MKLVELTREEITKMRAVDERSTAIGLSRETYFALLDAAESYVSRKSVRSLEAALEAAGAEIIALRRRVLALEQDVDALVALYSTDSDPKVAMARERKARIILQQLRGVDRITG